MEINDQNFSIRINQHGVRKLIDQLEEEIMDIVWFADDRNFFTVKDIYRVLRETRDISYGRVMLTVSKLVDKGLLSIVDTIGINNCYAAVCSKEELMNTTIEQVMRVLFTEYPAQTIRCIASHSANETHVVDAMSHE